MFLNVNKGIVKLQYGRQFNNYKLKFIEFSMEMVQLF